MSDSASLRRRPSASSRDRRREYRSEPDTKSEPASWQRTANESNDRIGDAKRRINSDSCVMHRGRGSGNAASRKVIATGSHGVAAMTTVQTGPPSALPREQVRRCDEGWVPRHTIGNDVCIALFCQ